MPMMVKPWFKSPICTPVVGPSTTMAPLPVAAVFWMVVTARPPEEINLRFLLIVTSPS